MTNTTEVRNPIKVIFEGAGARTEKTFDTIAETVGYLSKNGYIVKSGGYSSAVDAIPRIYTRLYRSNHKGRYARINTSSTPSAWVEIVAQIVEMHGPLA